MKKLKQKLKKLNKVFSNFLLYLFIFLLPTQFGKHFFFDFSYISGVRIDYLSIIIYAVDILAFILVILNAKNILRYFDKKTLLIFVFLAIVNIAVSLSKPVAIYKWIRVAELFFIAYLLMSVSYNPRRILHVFLASTALQFFLIVTQFIGKQSLQGIFYFLGERYFNLSTPGIAKTSLQGVEILRPYGTFSHPNSMAGFYVLMYAFIISHNPFRKFLVLKNVLILFTALLILLSFSKVAIFTFITVTFLYFVLSQEKKRCIICIVARSLVMLTVSSVFFWSQNDPYTIEKRLALIKQSFFVLSSRPFFGTGLGSYLLSSSRFNLQDEGIFGQPVHNIFLLFFSEFGLVLGLLILIMLIRPIRKFFLRYPLIIISIVLTGMFDHYWYTLPQNMFLLAFVVGITTSAPRVEAKKI